jgi:hypothetical protein
VADREQIEVEGNWITRWVIQFPSGDRRDGDPLGLGFDGGEHMHNSLWLGAVVAGVSDGGVVADVFKSMMVLPSSGAEVVIWLVHASPFADKGVTPSVRP